ncbi:conserved hypothetical protein [Truepera radiovictrix DSM 17093]|uniref:Polymerase nucleotidyl transferase domain-containing protein n=1 Tax=Truepera radiovictrix (strain DSM 17093 / CIP 108686 / LMG 22925 / RQ-24) TaxID=649638 RepID=D7CR45_TRURR|nr:conserved hypothetical protein [Truepera radiovictrix DSM 17093]
MRRLSLSSVQVFYPAWTAATLTETLKQRVAQLHEVLPLKQAVLFGSWSKGRATVASDIDVLLVYRGEAREGCYALAWRTLAVPGIELHLYSEAEAAEHEKLLSEMTAGGITLFEPPQGPL